MMKKKDYNSMDWSEKHKSPVVESYQPSEKEFSGMQEGKTLNYIERRDRIQSEAASLVKKQTYKGRYD
jgi:hypothetical protein